MDWEIEINTCRYEESSQYTMPEWGRKQVRCV